MCWACAPGGRAFWIEPEVLARARQIEAAMPGEAVPEQAWRIVLGEMDGSIDIAQFERMREALYQAESPPTSRLRCDGVTD